MISLESWECVRQGKPYTEEAILYDLQLLGGAVMTQQEMCERWHIKARETVRKILRALSVKGKIVLITTSAKTAINLPKTDIVPRPNCQRVANELPTGCQRHTPNIRETFSRHSDRFAEVCRVFQRADSKEQFHNQACGRPYKEQKPVDNGTGAGTRQAEPFDSGNQRGHVRLPQREKRQGLGGHIRLDIQAEQFHKSTRRSVWKQ